MGFGADASENLEPGSLRMKILSGFLVFLLLRSVCWGAEKPLVFYAQLIRGTDQDAPEAATWKPLGPKLSRHLCPKFRWKNYWEVSRESLQVKPGSASRVKLNPDREVEIELHGAQDSEIRLYHKGVLIHRSRQSLNSPMSIMGGARENDESWFVVVRRDKPVVD